MGMVRALSAKRDYPKQLGNAQNPRHEDGSAFSTYLAFPTPEDRPSPCISSPYKSQKGPLPPPAEAGVLRSVSCPVTAHCQQREAANSDGMNRNNMAERGWAAGDLSRNDPSYVTTDVSATLTAFPAILCRSTRT